MHSFAKNLYFDASTKEGICGERQRHLNRTDKKHSTIYHINKNL